MVLQTWGDILVASFQSVWLGVAQIVPRFVGAVVVFIIGWLVAVTIGKLVHQVLRSLKVDGALDKLGVRDALSRGGLHLDSGAFVGGLVKWFIILIFLLTAADILNLPQISGFLQSVLSYLPSVIVAAVILLAAALVADVVYKLVKASAEAAHLRGAFIAGVTKWAIWIFAIMAALFQLGLFRELVNTLLTGLVAMLAIAGGLAFGLGGKDYAQDFLERLKKDITG